MNILKLELKRSILASVITLSVVLFSWADISVAQGNCEDCGGDGSGNGILIPNSEFDTYFPGQNRLWIERAFNSCDDCGGGPGSPSDSGDGPGGGSAGGGSAGGGDGPSSCMGLPSPRRGNPSPRDATSAELKAFLEEERRLNEEDRLANKEYLRACSAARR